MAKPGAATGSACGVVFGASIEARRGRRNPGAEQDGHAMAFADLSLPETIRLSREVCGRDRIPTASSSRRRGIDSGGLQADAAAAQAARERE